MPWARHHAAGAARHLPPWADRDELTSQVLGAVWHCCQRFDPDRAGEWGALLWTRVRGARLDAARTDDPLSRRQRQLVTAEDAPAAERRRDPVRVAAEPAERIIASAADPASEVIAAEVAKAVGRWLRDDLPEDLAARLTSWWHRTGAIAPPPPNLALAIDGYIFRLASAIALARD